jgi:hypothetical protein
MEQDLNARLITPKIAFLRAARQSDAQPERRFDKI